MQHALCLEGQRIAEELYALLTTLDPLVWRQDLEAAARHRLEKISARVRVLMESVELPEGDHGLAQLRERISAVGRVVDEHIDRLSRSARQRQKDWRLLTRRLQAAHEGVAASLKLQDIHVAALRPTNHGRKFVHVALGLVSLMLAQHVLDRTGMIAVMVCIAGWAWSMEYLRRGRPELNAKLMAVFHPIAHPHEWHRVNSATWYSTALLLLALFAPLMAASTALVVLAFADPTAAIIGRRFGRVKLRYGRTLEGCCAFVAAGTAAAAVTLAIYYPEVGPWTAMAIAGIAAFAGAVAELFSQKIDDNISVPLAVAATTVVLMLLLGL
jgi:dolichol kinase